MSTYTDFVNFLKDGNRYKAENFSIYTTFNDLSNGVSHFVIAQVHVNEELFFHVYINEKYFLQN